MITHSHKWLHGKAQWVGNDASSFRSDWQSHHRTQLNNVTDALSDASSRATNNADQQEQASA
jgi:NADH:ubiquinone oxidoreductase subunit